MDGAPWRRHLRAADGRAGTAQERALVTASRLSSVRPSTSPRRGAWGHAGLILRARDGAKASSFYMPGPRGGQDTRPTNSRGHSRFTLDAWPAYSRAAQVTQDPSKRSGPAAIAGILRATGKLLAGLAYTTRPVLGPSTSTPSVKVPHVEAGSRPLRSHPRQARRGVQPSRDRELARLNRGRPRQRAGRHDPLDRDRNVGATAENTSSRIPAKLH